MKLDDDDIAVVGTVTDSIRALLAQDSETAYEYLKVSFLSSAIISLFYARRRASLTQADIAERLHTKQSAVARLEADHKGSVSLRRYVDYCLACGVLPLDISLEPVHALREYALIDPDAPRTETAIAAWRKPAPTEKMSRTASDTVTDAPLPEGLIMEALEKARATDDESTRSLLLRLLGHSLTATLPTSLYREALDVSLTIKDDNSRARVLNALLPHLPDQLRDEARLELQRAIEALQRSAVTENDDATHDARLHRSA